MSDFYIKYIKYKNKYTNLKNKIGIEQQQIGIEQQQIGIENKTGILVTHNARLRCFLDDFFPDVVNKLLEHANNNLDKNLKIKEIRFKNSCVLELSVTNPTQNTKSNNQDYKDQQIIVEIKMCYEGNVEKRKNGKYFVVSNENEFVLDLINSTSIENYKSNLEKQINGTNILKDSNGHIDIIFPHIKINLYNMMNLFEKFPKFPALPKPNTKYRLFIIRHGESEHNVSKINIKMDTGLTNSGKTETKIAGKKLIEYLIYNKISVNNYFSSHLKRTRETLSIIDLEFRENKYFEQSSTPLPNEIIVLPCSHELSYTHGNCDLSNAYKPIPPENQKICSTNNYSCKHNDLCCNINGLHINWNFYNDFYKNNYHCRNTNIISEIIKVYN